MNNIIREIYKSHDLLRLATLDENGFPNVRSVDFANDPDDESVLYFTTFKNTNKVKEIAANPSVYILIDKEADTIEKLAQIKYIRGKGKAICVQDPAEVQKAMGLLIAKYPFLPELPGDPSMMSIYKIQVSELRLADNEKGFGHVDYITY